ncbi:putative F-box domain-containing protein [Helianthus annuus]|nr:putative F-box domain-containing protein [Helianthus annuus]KAJ0850976.1 putative F-box domain-containing protein [Helianthus annuus]
MVDLPSENMYNILSTLTSKKRLQAAILPSEIIYDILSRMPVKSLARFRCVNKLWCNYINDPYLEAMHTKRPSMNDPVPIMFRQFPSDDHPNSPCTLSFLEHKEEAGICTLEVKKKPPVMEFMCKSWTYRNPDNIVLGSCNGRLYSSKHSHDGNKLVVIHPLRKDCYESPPIKTPFHPQQQQSCGIDLQESNRLCVEESSGLGFDDSTNTFKMVCVVKREHEGQLEDLYQLKEDLWTMVHVLGTDSWRKIPQVPSYPITGEGVFANGCLHWLISDEYDDYRAAYLGRPVIKFDIAKEEFGVIKPPHELPDYWVNERLVDLHGEVGYVYQIVNHRMEVWVLKERGWVMHCEFELKPPLPGGLMKVLGFWNDNGDVLMTDNWKRQMFVYNLNSNSLHEVSLVGCEEGLTLIDIRMY